MSILQQSLGDLRAKAEGFTSKKSTTNMYLILTLVFLGVAFGLYQLKPKLILKPDGQICPYRVFAASALAAVAVYFYLFK